MITPNRNKWGKERLGILLQIEQPVCSVIGFEMRWMPSARVSHPPTPPTTLYFICLSHRAQAPLCVSAELWATFSGDLRAWHGCMTVLHGSSPVYRASLNKLLLLPGWAQFLRFLVLIFFYWIFFIYISNVISFPGFQFISPPITSPTPFFYEGVPSSTTPFPPWHSPTLGGPALAGPRASSPIGAQQGHPLLHRHLEPCVLFGW